MVIQIQTQNAGHAIPNYAPIAQGMQNFGQGLGSFFKQRRDEEKERKKREALSRIFQSENPLQAATEAGMGGDSNVLNSIFMRRKLQARPAAAERKTIKGADGYHYYMDTGERVLKGVKKDIKDKTPTAILEYETAKKRGYIPAGTTFTQYQVSKRTREVHKDPQRAPGAFHPKAGDVAKRVGPGYMWDYNPKTDTYREDENGNPIAIPIRGAKTEAPSETQGKASLFADRLADVQTILNSTTADGAPLDTVGTSLLGSTLSGGVLPDWAPGSEAVQRLTNYAQSEDYQKFDQARRNFVNAVLRRESGAVISEEEFDNANKQYFPQPGDTPQVIAQKRKNREDALTGMKRDAGPLYRRELEHRPPEQPAAPIPPAEGGGGVMGALSGAGEAVANLFTGGADEVVPTANEVPGMMRPPENPSIPPIMAAQAEPAPEANPYHPMPPLQVNVPATPADKEATKEAFPDLDPAAQLKLVATMTPQDVQDMLPQINQASDAVRAAVKARLRSLLSTGK